MRIIDRYLLRQFVQTFVICFLSLVGIVIVFDLLHELRSSSPAGKANGGVMRFIGRYYMFQTIGLFDRVGGLLAIVSAMFTVSWIQRNNEMTALMAAGVSHARVAADYRCGGRHRPDFGGKSRNCACLAVGTRCRWARKIRRAASRRAMTSRYDSRPNVLLGGRNSFADQQRIEEPRFRMPPGLAAYGVELTADNAYYKAPCKAAEGDRPGGYLFKGVRRPRTSTPGGRCRSAGRRC